MKSNISKICATLATATLIAAPLHATTYVVSNKKDSGAGSLRQAIINANSGHGGNIISCTVSGTIALSSSLPAIAANVNIIGPGTNSLKVSGGNHYSIFTINAGTTCLIMDLTIADGYASPVGFTAAYASGVANYGMLQLQNCIVTNCTDYATDGGAVYNAGTLAMKNCFIVNSGSTSFDSEIDGGGVFNNASLTMMSCVISNCSGTVGGGIFNEGTAQLSDCSILACDNDDSDGNGGGIYSFSGNLSLTNCRIAQCTAGFWGGGIASFGNLAMTNTVITNNESQEGGGLYLPAGTNFAVGCTISGNSETAYGGGGIKNLSQLTMLNCTISGNSSTAFIGGGGGVANLNLLMMTNCTISGNTCSGPAGGGGILVTTNNWNGPTASATTYLTDCTIVSNTPGGIVNSGGKVYSQTSILANNSTNDFSGALISLGHNLVKNTSNCALTGDSTGNLYGVDPLLGPLHNNGGPTMTHALLAGSPAINAGPLNSAPTFDQRGNPRPRGGADDIGSFEYGIFPARAVLSLSLLGHGGFHINFAGTASCNYVVQRAPSLTGPWTTVTNVSTTCEGIGDSQDTVAPVGKAFYRTISAQ